MTTEDVEALAAQVNALSPPDRLRLAAGLMEERKSETALPIIQKVAGELALALFLARYAGECGKTHTSMTGTRVCRQRRGHADYRTPSGHIFVPISEARA